MEQSNHEHEHEHERAYQRGRNVAKAWKRLSSAIKHWDNVCVGKVQERNLPSWIGHIPIVFLGVVLVALLSTYAIVSLASLGCIIALWAVASIIQNALRQTTGATSQTRLKKNSYERFSWENEPYKNTYDRQTWHQND
ncbi:MFS transporter [Serratia plymuthica]|uniref:MFS transporter n=1 Tax=Serratia TaxID=613 RepID=UPI0011AB21ED|nr:MFS transporter [Serratia plymuthica]